MSKLVWDNVSDRDYAFGVDRGVFYPLNGPGQVWNGLVSVEESPSEADDRPRYLDGKRIGNRRRQGEFSATVSALTYPSSFSPGLIAPIQRTHFGLSYRTETANGHQIHIVYNAVVSPSQNNYVYDENSTFQWTLTTRGMKGPGNIVVSHLVIDTSVAYPAAVEAFEDILYGTDATAPRIPDPFEAFDIFEANAILRIIDHGDGTWTAVGPDEAITVNPDGTFEIDWPSAVYISADTYKLSSL